jgi:nicotinate-nucleotide--dimethylbenzimidazole phosphoribosyltransferase
MIPTWTFQPPSETSRSAALARQEKLTKPPGSLGALEEIAVQLAAWQGRDTPRSRPAQALLFASDHPVVRHGVSAYPPEVTAAMVANFTAGGAAASVASRALGIPLRVVDVGVRSRVQAGGPIELVRDPVADLPAGDLRTEDAMPEATYAAALAAGRRQVDSIPEDAALLILGEMGIGNSTAAAAVAASLLGIPAREAVGPGTGVRGAALERKVQVVADAVARVGKVSPHRAMQALGGRDLAAMMGAAARALERRMAVLVDGFIVTAALLPLLRLHPEARAGLVFAHRSAEPGHQRLLDALEARPLLDLGLRLGEGSGALAALPLVDLACALHGGMASFEEARVPGPAERQ